MLDAQMRLMQSYGMNYPSLQQMITALIASPSVSSVSPTWDQSNQGVIEILASWCRDAGFTVEILEVPDNPNKYNMIASAGTGTDGLVLSGHTDTVPFDDNKWTTDPFKLNERDNRWYGLGTCDMKGFFAVVLEAIRELDLSTLKHPLVILATADEESSMSGAKALLQAQRQLGRHAVIGEPTNLKPIRMHKGINMEAIRLTGLSGHSSNPALGNNAMEGMHKVIGELMAWRSELQQRFSNPLFAVQTPTLNLGHIHGGDNPNRICSHCELHFDIRALPGMDIDELHGELDQRLATILQGSGLQLERTPLIDAIPPMHTDASAEIVRAAEQFSEQTADAVAFCTEAPYLSAMGLETVVLGPGSIDQAHQPDEYIAMDQLKPAIKIIQNLINKFCL